MRYEADEFSEPENARRQLEDTHQHNSREQVLNAMLRDERNHNNRQRAGRARYHARTATNHGRHEADNEGRIQPDQRVHARHESESHGLRHERQGDCQAGQQFDLDPVRRELGEAGLRQALGAKAICEGCKSRFYHGMTLFDLRAGRCLPPYGDLPPAAQPQA